MARMTKDVIYRVTACSEDQANWAVHRVDANAFSIAFMSDTWESAVDFALAWGKAEASTGPITILLERNPADASND